MHCAYAQAVARWMARVKKGAKYVSLKYLIAVLLINYILSERNQKHTDFVDIFLSFASSFGQFIEF